MLTALALALVGFAAMGMEILWLRHFTLLLGGFRAVFALLITVVLIGIAAGSLLGGVLVRRTAHPAQALMVTQALFVVSALAGIGAFTLLEVLETAGQIQATLGSLTPWQRTLAELWFNARPMLVEAGLPALLMGCSFPLANGVIQHAEQAVGRRAGVLYLANTTGAVAGSIVAGYLLLPGLGLKGSATFLLAAAALAIVPLQLATCPRGASLVRLARADLTRSAPRQREPRIRASRVLPAACSLLAAGAIAAWLALPPEFLLRRSMPPLEEGERLVALSEGVTEVVAVTEKAGRGRGLFTNGHPMSSTAPLDQRYMRALAHIPLLSMDAPESVLVIGFGVGNTTHAASRHPSVRRIDVADLSQHVLEHAPYFDDVNGGVLAAERVRVYVNDGRQHLQMQPAGTYDLITLEPPPISHAGVAALYSREFYTLARSRLRDGGFLSQWLPAYQVPSDAVLSMVRAFIDVFPQAVLLSGAQAELLLVGTTAARIEIDPHRVSDVLGRAPDVLADLRRVDMGSVTEIVGTFVASAETLARATRASPPATDGRPLQEYGVRSMIGSGLLGVPASIFDLTQVDAWCPRCAPDPTRPPVVAGLDDYLALLNLAYHAPVAEVAAAAAAAEGRRRILGSAYLGAVVPDSADVHAALGDAWLREGRIEDALVEFREALRRDPRNGGAHYELGSLLLERGQFAEAVDHFEAALATMADSAYLHNNLGIALASGGAIDRAIEHFEQALGLQPDFTEARQNLAAARQVRGASARGTG